MKVESEKFSRTLYKVGLGAQSRELSSRAGQSYLRTHALPASGIRYQLEHGKS